MHGRNQITKPNYESDMIRVKSIFYTIQGEGPFSGHPAVFVRLAGCNLKCWFCDTDFEGGEEVFDENLFTAIDIAARPHDCRLVVITGGEPMVQNIGALCAMLLDSGFVVQIETSGSASAPRLPYGESRFHVVCSPKTGTVHPDMEYATAWKYVVRLSHCRRYNTSTFVRNQRLTLTRG